MASWTKEEEQYIIDNAPHIKDVELLKNFNSLFNKNLKLQNFRKKRIRLGIRKDPKIGRGRFRIVEDL